MDEFHGQSGTYIVRDGKRERVEGSVTKPHPEGDAPRNEHGKRLDAPDPNVKSEPAMPAPAPAIPAKIDEDAAAQVGETRRARRGAAAE